MEEMYESWKANESSVDVTWRDFFQKMEATTNVVVPDYVPPSRIPLSPSSASEATNVTSGAAVSSSEMERQLHDHSLC